VVPGTHSLAYGLRSLEACVCWCSMRAWGRVVSARPRGSRAYSVQAVGQRATARIRNDLFATPWTLIARFHDRPRGQACSPASPVMSMPC